MTDAPKRSPVRWSKGDDEKLLRLRDIDRLGWQAISEAFQGRTPAACEMRYYGKLKGARDQQRRQPGPRPVKAAGYKRRSRTKFLPAPAAPLQPPKPPVVERRRMPSLDHLREAAELRLRIDRQGLTAGFFGDPPPGRSALDERTRASAGAAQRPLPGGAGDAG